MLYIQAEHTQKNIYYCIAGEEFKKYPLTFFLVWSSWEYGLR